MTKRRKTLIFTAFFGNYNFPVSGGPDGELAASMRYLSQRYTMPYREVTGILTDIGTEHLLLHTPSFNFSSKYDSF